MKPGLRKVIALILVSVTLFGSGASVVSAAYADDTTMGTSTRIQTEPDVKTTTGGDEAATKPDAGSGDEAGTGADEQSDAGAPAQSAPQADAGQAAPDVTVHDMLDTDSAAVSRLRLIDRITGTAEAIKITPEERATAVQAAKIMGLDVAGVDILRSARGPLVLEVNSSPGLQGVEAASGKDVAGKIIEFLELKASRKHKPAE
mgnify:CR=1 FL=1